jgi:hypothetical protein
VKLVFIHGMDVEELSPVVELQQWCNALFPPGGRPAPPDISLAFWADLSVWHEPLAIPELSDPVWDELLKLSTDNHFLGDVFNYFYFPQRRQLIKQRMIDLMAPVGTMPPEPTVVVAHSLGCVIAYDVLSSIVCNIPLFVTIGCPLGLPPVQAELRRLFATQKLLAPPMVQRWANFSDELDPVALVHKINGLFGTGQIVKGALSIDDQIVKNPMAPLQPHSILGYLTCPEIRKAVYQAV